MNIVALKRRLAISLKVRPVLLAYYLMITVTIFNTNKYHASLAFILYPVLLAFSLCLVKFQCMVDKLKGYFVIVLICVSTIISTFLSDVVSWSMTANSFLIFVLLYILLTVGKFNNEEIKSVLKFYAYITLFLALWILINLIFSRNLTNGRVSITFLGVLKDANYLSAYMTFGFFYFLVALLLGSKKKKYILYSGLIFVAIFMTGSRGGLVAMLAGLSVVIIKFIFLKGVNGRSIITSIGIVLCIFIAYIGLKETTLFSRMSDVDGYTENIRLTIWGYAIEGFLRRPWIGSGIQSGTYFSQLHVRWYTHSCFVDLITSVGIIGGALYIWQYITFCKVKKENVFFIVGMLLVLFVPLMFINGFETATFWMPMALCKLVSDYCKHNNFCDLIL
ncbi:O-antigen ligase family protein [Ruminococcus gauvreauii]|uniref:O-antigen ligase family protein n=1 Tax=Ruminococcus gauvreauii TaxID=438033 RepID=UPI0039845E44